MLAGKRVPMELLISAGLMLAGSRGEQVADAAVLVRGAQIVAAGSRTAVEPLASPAADRLNCPDSTIVPGLIDCHVHLAFDGLPDPATRLAELDDAGLMLDMAARARRLLDSGVTTVRDLGDRRGLVTRLRDAIAEGLLPGPRILAATAPLRHPAGTAGFSVARWKASRRSARWSRATPCAGPTSSR